MSFGGGTSGSSSNSASDSSSQSLTDMLSNSMGWSTGASGNQSQGSSFGSGTSQSTGYGQSSGQGSSFGNTDSFGNTSLDPVQQQRMQAMWGQGANLVGQQKNMQQTAQGIVNPLMAQGRNAMKTLGGLQDVTGMVNAQTAGLQSGLARLGLEQRNKIGDAATGQGAFGGSRHGVAEGVAQGETNRAFQEGYGDILSFARQQAGAAAGLAGNLAPQLANLGMMPSQAAWAPLKEMQNLLGPATVLSQQGSTGRQGSTSSQQSTNRQQATSQNLSKSLQSAFGWSKQQAENFANAMTKSTSSSVSKTRAKSKSSSANVNVSVGRGANG